MKRYGVRYGDDGRWLFDTDDRRAADKFAKKLADDKGKAQLLDRETGQRITVRADWW